MPLNPKQQIALESVKTHKLSIITGAPGTGKTFTLKSVLDWASSQNLTVSLAGPTGKSSKQMSSVTGYQASTIHRMLEPKKEKDGFSFAKNEFNLLESDLIVLDECSMITNDLMASVLRAIDFHQTRLLLIGDNYQLPSVGAGAVLRDLIESGVVPCVELTEIQRNSGDIVRACHLIKDSKFYEPSDILDPENGFNLRHVEAKSPESIRTIIKQIVCERMPARGFDPVWDVQVLSPTNKRTVLSCDGLNEVLQAELNAGGRAVEGYKLRVGDKVINTKNEKVSTATGDEELIVNGDIGKVVDIDKPNKRLVVEFFDPSRTVVLPMYDHNLLLAYCITCHRFQGSESPVVVIPFHSGFNFFVNRPWVYTVISRAKTICITVGQMSAIRAAIKRDEAYRRRTRLVEKLKLKGESN